MLRLCRATTRPLTANAVGGACRTSTLKNVPENLVVTRIDTDRARDVTTIDTQAVEMIAQGNEKTTVIVQMTVLVMMVG